MSKCVGCLSCQYFATCPDASSEVSSYCGSWDKTEMKEGTAPEDEFESFVRFANCMMARG